MKVANKRVLLCSCEGSMPVDGKAVAKALGADEAVVHRQLCRAQLDVVQAALDSGEPLVIACGQEAPLFAEMAEEAGQPSPAFVDIRERAGWSDEAARAAPKMAALIAESLLELEPTPVVTLSSAGRVLVLGAGEEAMEAAKRLADQLPTTLLLTGGAQGVLPPTRRAFVIHAGQPRRAEGWLGAFQVTVEGLAQARPASRGRLEFDTVSGGGALRADMVLDLTGGALMRERDGWLKVDPRVPAQLEKALAEAVQLVGEFEKPRYIKVDTALCAHSRNQKVACTRCMDACPSSAIQPRGDHAFVDAHLCDGHGACASACPTGAIRYDFPAANGVFKRLSTLLETYHAGGGAKPVLLVHEPEHGGAMIAALARTGAGLPAHVLPMAVNAVAAMGLEVLLTALAKGAARVVVLADPRRKVDLGPLLAAADLAGRVSGGLGWGPRVAVLREADPAALAAALAEPAPAPVQPAAEFLVLGGKRQTLSLALSHLARHAPRPVETLPLAAGDPFGAVAVDQGKCTLCLACIQVCPANALSGHPDKPSLGFLEANCVQCGLCKATCPEAAITLLPRLNFTAEARLRAVLKEEEPYCCAKCGKPFGTRSSIEKMLERLSGHAMFAGTGRLDLLKMCEDCRVVAQYEGEDKDRPMAHGAPRVTRTTDDYR